MEGMTLRVALTVVAPAMRRTANVLLEADPATQMADVSAELAAVIAGDTVERHDAPGYGGGQQHGARVLRFPGLEAQGSFALSSPAPSAARMSVPLYLNRRQIPPQLSLAQAPIRDGAVVSLGDPDGCVSPEQAGLVEIRVTSGPAAGSIWRLSAGHWDIGSGRPAAVRIGDPAVPAAALRIFVNGRGGCQVAPYEGVGAAVDREPLAAPAQWQPGQTLAIGNSLLGLAPYEPPDAALRPSLDGSGLDFNRPPRLLRPERATRFQLPVPPSEADRRPLPILMAALPLVMGVAMAFLLHQVYLLAMAGLSPLMLVGSYFSERSNGRKTRGRQLAAYREHKARIERDARMALEAERADRRERFPDPAEVFSIASGPRRRLWGRRRSDPDYLLLRVGTADLPSAVTLTDPELDEHRREVTWLVPDAPVTISLSQRGVIGVAGPGDAPRAIGRWLVAQTAALHSPSDVQVCLLTDVSGQDSWGWSRWLPHSRPATGQDCAVLPRP
jgi:DNA segregation ATPase FtsK/SpoIIIE, S-DNA-T family